MNLDWIILNKIQGAMSSGFMDMIMPKITLLGSAGIIWIIIGVALLISKKHRRIGFLVLIGLLLELIIGNGILKNLVARPRPCWLNHDFKLLVTMPKDYSFPSGHTFASVIATTILVLYRKEWGWFLLPLTVVIAFSRLYLYVHFPSDVLAGAVLGVIIGCITYYAGNKIIDKIINKKKITSKTDILK